MRRHLPPFSLDALPDLLFKRSFRTPTTRIVTKLAPLLGGKCQRHYMMDIHDFYGHDEDEHMRAAIRASLSDVKARPLPPPTTASAETVYGESNFVDLTVDSDSSQSDPQRPAIVATTAPKEGVDESDAELEEAIKLSLMSHGSSGNADAEGDQPSGLAEGCGRASKEDAPISTSSNPLAGILGIDRKKMEEERLARLNRKRKASSTPGSPALKHASIMMKCEDVPASAAVPGPHLRANAPRVSGNETINIGTSSHPMPLPSAPLQFPKGAVKKTWAFGYDRTGDDIKFEEVVQKSDLELAVLSSYMWNVDWMFSKFDIKTTRFLLIMGEKEEDKKRELENDTKSMGSVRLCFPPMEPQVNCMHSKLMLLFHPDYLRIVVPSANLVPFDWGEQGGVMENIVFLIDLPRKSPDSGNDPQTPFLDELVYFLQASTVNEQIIKKMLRFDFSATKDIAFIHTIGGSHTDPKWEKTGLCGLGRAITSLNLQTSQDINLDYITSSVGSLNEQFLRSIYLAAQGDNGLKELTLRTSRTFPSEKWGVVTNKSDGAKWKDKFRVYFPSLNTVRNSKGGIENAGTICFQSKWYNSATFPKDIMRDNISRREGLLMHNKMLFVRPDKPITSVKNNSIRYSGWTYVGSANLSESAWGRLVLDRATTKPKLNCRNWECGVVIPIRHNDEEKSPYIPSTRGITTSVAESGGGNTSAGSDDGSRVASVFEPTVPVPMKVPAQRYHGRDRPFFYMED
ncbi:tyrosyl-DNA phosphodiesterase domain-containing protein [Histoplasma capsulatum G186AR]|uniref:Tyrosyl-DNA phosphodiesterase domain-containing protein n=1 Tax=Ajellomyces capsulatus TaxID=5037 RepID=A0A8H8D046_AJECA|nr:tyrosyl-DNA phosphodiesterase domain-containing protein [Histoplasma capsulatum]QSS74130.1 tyrosyl-DNA phosphodiesterase domain-containing protein [Histoplasma capsulatum G186AR]